VVCPWLWQVEELLRQPVPQVKQRMEVVKQEIARMAADLHQWRNRFRSLCRAVVNPVGGPGLWRPFPIARGLTRTLQVGCPDS
jgi:hypothetical protein